MMHRASTQEGSKVFCGSTTADIVARVVGQPLKILELSTSFASPPTYEIAGLDLVTERAVTLNQIYNILEEDLEDYQGGSCVGEICRMMKQADMIRFFVGGIKRSSWCTSAQSGVGRLVAEEAWSRYRRSLRASSDR